jgi:MFS family permease
MIPFVRERPGPGDIEPKPARAKNEVPASDAQPSQGEPMKVGQILRLPVFWLYTLSVGLSLGAMQTTAASIPPVARDGNFSDQQSAWLLTVLAAMSIFSKVMLATVGDRFDRVKLLTILYFCMAVASGVLLVADGYAALLACSALTGIAVGAVTPAFYALLADRVGAASFGTANGAATMIMSLCGIIALRFGGEVYDRTGSYDLMFITFIAVSLVSALLMTASRRFSRAAPVGVLT